MDNANTIMFTVETFIVDDNRKLGKGVCDKDGYYTGVPVAVLGTTTRNLTTYDTPSFIHQLKDSNSAYYKRLSEGCLFGEWGHPFVNLRTEEGLARLLHLDPQKESHHIRATSVQHVADLNLDLVLADIKPAGPYGKYYEEAMNDPTRNLAHSLRGICKGTTDPKTGVTHKRLISLTTFDAGVASGGFKEASKRYMEAKEDLCYASMTVLDQAVTPNDLVLAQGVAMESFTDTELNELLKMKRVVVGEVVTGYVDANSKLLIDPETGTRRSVFHKFVKTKRS